MLHSMLTRLAVAAALLAAGACKKADKPAPAPQVEVMSPAEIQRSEDACRAYVERVCACAATVPEAGKPCQLARALPDAVRIGLEVAASPDSKPDIVQQSYASVRKTVKECIEQTAKLPALGCP
jgi:hypothetical protein